MDMEVDEMAFHVDCLQLFKERLYNNVFTKDMIVTLKKAIQLRTLEGKQLTYGYYLEKEKQLYFMLADLFNELPFKAPEQSMIETDYKGDVFTLITPPVTTIKFTAEKKLSFRDLIDYAPNFEHSEPLHYTLSKIIGYTAIIDRINARIVTDAGFGKDSIAELLQQLVGGVPNLYGATFAKLEYLLNNKVIVLNEMGNLSSTEKSIMQNFLLAAGAYFNVYTKRTRKTTMTQEMYDISKLSLLIFQNLPSYYINQGQEYFENMFTPAVPHRFMPFVFEGRLTTNFESSIDAERLVEDHDSLYKYIISTVKYYQKNKPKTIDYEIPDEVKFSKHEKRHERTFMTVLKYMSEYASDQDEFNVLSKELYDCYRRYKELIQESEPIGEEDAE